MKIGILGGGASGLLCAVTVKRNHPEYTVEILEKADKTGKKILATGNGRCNLTNKDIDIKYFHSGNLPFVKGVLDDFSKEDTISFFKELGLLISEGEKGKLYPRSLQASSVLDVLRLECLRLGVCEITGFKVSKVKEGFTVYSADGKQRSYDKIVVACGGMSGENLGSDGDGYDILKSFGHKMTPIFQSLVQIKCDNTYTKALNGTKITVLAKLVKNDEVLEERTDELHFTDYGLSGPLSFNMSRSVSQHFSQNQDIFMSIDFMKELSYEETSDFVKTRVKEQGYKTLEDFFTGVFSKRCGQMIIKKSTDKKFSEKASALTDKEILAVINNIKAFKVKLMGVMPFKNSQVTAGGIKLDGFDPKTLQSKFISGLFACGEVLDVDGDCGGYNLQWAWSSGYKVGINL